MDLYHKPTSTQRYLLYSASHSKQCLKNILYVMTRQVCAIEGNNSITNKCLNELKRKFENYGYTGKMVGMVIQKNN